LPDIPAGLSALPLEDDGSDLYDELNRNVAPNQIKAKSKSVKGNAQLAMGVGGAYFPYTMSCMHFSVQLQTIELVLILPLARLHVNRHS